MAKAKNTTQASRRAASVRTAKSTVSNATVKLAKARKKIVAEGKQKAKDTAVLTTLTPIAKEGNHKLEQADKASGQALDYRVSAALRLAEAAKICKKAKLTFKKWVEGNIDKSYKDAVMLAHAGAEKDTMAAVMLIRSRNAVHNKALRERKKVSSRERTGDTPADHGAIAISPFEYAVQSVAALDDQPALNLAADIAATKGMSIISNHDRGELEDYRTARKDEAKLSLSRVKHDFDGLDAADKMALVVHAAKKVGVEIVKPSFDPVADRPAFLDRSPGLTTAAVKT